MGVIKIHPRVAREGVIDNPLPGLIQTPSGLALLEIQGTLNSTAGGETDEIGQSAIDIGKLSFPLYHPADTSNSKDWQKKVHLYVGSNQRLTGELKKLPNPVAIIRKRQTPGEASEDLEMVDIIYYKLSFTHRPEPFGTVIEG